MPVIAEVCIESVEGARIAERTGADRIELCCGLTDGGLTPPAGLLRAVRRAAALPLMVLVRPRAGDFVYDEEELAVMSDEVRFARAEGADGVVIGCLRPDGTVDDRALDRLRREAGPLAVTFHRAFDMSREPGAALERLVDAGIDRVLTSGGARDVVAGAGVIRSLVEQASDRMIVMPGGGVRPENARQVVDETGARELHFSGSSVVDGPAEYRDSECVLGPGRSLGEFERRCTSEDAVRRILSALR